MLRNFQKKLEVENFEDHFFGSKILRWEILAQLRAKSCVLELKKSKKSSLSEKHPKSDENVI